MYIHIQPVGHPPSPTAVFSSIKSVCYGEHCVTHRADVSTFYAVESHYATVNNGSTRVVFLSQLFNITNRKVGGESFSYTTLKPRIGPGDEASSIPKGLRLRDSVERMIYK